MEGDDETFAGEVVESDGDLGFVEVEGEVSGDSEVDIFGASEESAEEGDLGLCGDGVALLDGVV